MGKKQTKPGHSSAEQADRHELYEAAVQNVAEECSLVDFVFEQVNGRPAISLREDFCGTAAAACEWVSTDTARYAFGVDIDPEVLDWGRRHRVAALKNKQQKRIALIKGDVLEIETPPVDALVALNFSYWIFRERNQLLRYFKSAFHNLEADGVFFLDAYGGPGATVLGKEKTPMDGFTYVWEQAAYSPVTAEMKTHIHFKFPDGSRIKRAFSYRWRVWTLPEIRDLLHEAGFVNPTAWFELKDDEGLGTGEWLPDNYGPPDSTWIANISAEKPG